MATYQMHPDHGRHIAYNGLEEANNIENGWKNVTKEEYYAGILKEEPKEDIKKELSHDELVELYESKFGKKPHHKMTSKTIQIKLDE